MASVSVSDSVSKRPYNPSIPNVEHGTWNMEPGTWNLERGTWNLNLEPRSKL